MSVDLRAKTDTDRREERDDATDLVTMPSEAGFGDREMLKNSTTLSEDGALEAASC